MSDELEARIRKLRYDQDTVTSLEEIEKLARRMRTILRDT